MNWTALQNAILKDLHFDDRELGDYFNIIMSSGMIFEKYIRLEYGETITAEQRHRLADTMYEIIQEVQGQPHIDWSNSKVIKFNPNYKRK